MQAPKRQGDRGASSRGSNGLGVLVGLDIGGTKTEALIVDEALQSLAQLSRPTDASGPAGVVRSATETVDEALATCGRSRELILATGIAVPGLVERASGLVRLAVNLNLEAYELGRAIEGTFGAPSLVENDVRTGALGAHRYANLHHADLAEASLRDANQNAPVNSLAYLSIGTGIAAGVILDGRLHRGASGMAGEIGHVVMEAGGPRCGCGLSGCLEALAAGPAVARMGEALMDAPAEGRPLTARDVYAAAARGEEAAVQVVRQASRTYAQAIQLLIMAYDVEMVALGGGVSRAGPAFLASILEALAELRATSDLARAMLPAEKILLLPADYSAGAWGAILLAQRAAGLYYPGNSKSPG